MKYTVIFYDGNEDRIIIIESPYDNIDKITYNDLINIINDIGEINQEDISITSIIEGTPEVRLLHPE